MNEGLLDWLNSVTAPGWRWYVKILSGNDTLLTKAHQAGPYVPKSIIFDLFPSIAHSSELNPRRSFHTIIDSHGVETDATAIWYNNKLIEQGTRDEARITGWGGRSSPLLDPESTGSLCVFAFHKSNGECDACRVWLCCSVEEEEAVTDTVGPIEPGQGIYFDAGTFQKEPVPPPPKDSPCRLTAETLPKEWNYRFPEATEIVARAVANLPSVRSLSPDARLLPRRDCEFELFLSIEELLVLPRIREGFATVEIFVDFANSVTNRRKSRSGRSLELQTKAIFEEEKLPHSHGQTTEGRKRPDFLFPSVEAYHDPGFPAEKLQMLGVKTTCKDRWRQVINEADRIGQKYLLTLQRGVSPDQFEEMKTEGVILVVPQGLHSSYVDSVRAELVSLSDFISSTRAKCA